MFINASVSVVKLHKGHLNILDFLGECNHKTKKLFLLKALY